MNVFIDANILIDFYRFSKGTLRELRKVVGLSKTGRIRIFLSDYLKDEIYRNREKKLDESIKAFETLMGTWEIPGIFTAYPAYQELIRLKAKLKEIKEPLISSVRRDIENSTLLADSIIKSLFDSTKVHIVPEIIKKRAVDRVVHGNPPGDKSCFGDAVHWEWLLSIVRAGEDLIIISKDRDFKSPLTTDGLKLFLCEEWSRKKESNCFLYTSLGKFLAKHFSHIRLDEDADRIEIVIRKKIQELTSQFPDISAAAIPVLENVRVAFSEAARNLSVFTFQDILSSITKQFTPLTRKEPTSDKDVRKGQKE